MEIRNSDHDGHQADHAEKNSAAVNDNGGAVKAILDESSSNNRNLFLSFLIFEVYMMIAVAGISDVQMLLPDSNVLLPLINVNTPLFRFFGIAPLFMLAMHFNLLFNLLQHSQKLFYWGRNATYREKRVLMQPFLFNSLIRFSPGQINYYLSRSVIYLLIYFLPLGLLVMIQWKFSEYHHFPMTCWHFLCVLSDLFILIFYWRRIVSPEYADDENEKWQEFWQRQIRPILRRTFLVPLWPLIWEARKVIGHRHPSKGAMAKDGTGKFRQFMGLILTNIFSIMVFGTSVIILLISSPLDRFMPESWRFIYPRLTVKNETIVKKRPSDTMIVYYLNKCASDRLAQESGAIPEKKARELAWLEFSEGVDLSGRDLRFAELGSSRLFNANLTDTDLEGADLTNAFLQKASLTNARLRNAVLTSARLEGAFLNGADLQKAFLSGASLQGAFLSSANLQGADLSAALWETNLEGADLSDADLRNADLSGANLQGAILIGANLQDANLTGANLQGADLTGAKLQSTDEKPLPSGVGM